jgi:hypothetical protein
MTFDEALDFVYAIGEDLMVFIVCIVYFVVTSPFMLLALLVWLVSKLVGKVRP